MSKYPPSKDPSFVYFWVTTHREQDERIFLDTFSFQIYEHLTSHENFVIEKMFMLANTFWQLSTVVSLKPFHILDFSLGFFLRSYFILEK